MTNQVYGDYVAKRVTDDNGSGYWLLFRSGEIAHPVLVLADAAAQAFAQVIIQSANKSAGSSKLFIDKTDEWESRSPSGGR